MRDEMTPTEQYDDVSPDEGGGIDEDVISSYVMGGLSFGKLKKHAGNPLAVKAATTFVPGAGATLAVAKAAKDPKTKNAAKVLAKARSGDPKAKAKILQVRKDAKAGDPASKQAVARLHAVNKLAKLHDLHPNALYSSGVT
jgi:hypothetical protein